MPDFVEVILPLRHVRRASVAQNNQRDYQRGMEDEEAVRALAHFDDQMKV
jgi:hypothetical protein